MKKMQKKTICLVCVFLFLATVIGSIQLNGFGSSNPVFSIPDINIDISEAQNSEDISSTIQVIMLLTV